MNSTAKLSMLAALALAALGAPTAQAQQATMSFFITSVGSGKGGDLGGLNGADAHCQSLAQAAGAGNRTWRAYLSNFAPPGVTPINARDRIGNGPWHNAKGVQIAQNVDDLHSANNKINKETGLNEKGEPTKGRGDTPNQHDILTGSQPDGRAFPGNINVTCNNWTSSSIGKALVGHHDRQGIADTEFQRSWNSSHMSRSCSQEDLVVTGGAGLFYCFAAQ
jgi:hypothetical protein